MSTKATILHDLLEISRRNLEDMFHVRRVCSSYKSEECLKTCYLRYDI